MIRPTDSFTLQSLLHDFTLEELLVYNDIDEEEAIRILYLHGYICHPLGEEEYDEEGEEEN